ncbi:MAG: penicillin acylase family protein [Bacteroidetes bacterium]|nr:penicillin acylase family protein [Bacteroidota bacterium]
MRMVRALFALILTVVLIVVLDRPLAGLPALGRLLDPMNGWAANAEKVADMSNWDFSLKGLKQPASVWLEDRLVPHLKAENNHDLYFIQGYIHAFYRLWQMDFQTRAASGRLSEIIGEKWVTDIKTGKRKNALLEFDRLQRRKGMIFAADNSLKAMEADPRTKAMLDAYTAGVNYRIRSLHYADYPIEYKLMGFDPEPWTNIKCVLLLKYMADDLTGYTEDIELTALRDQLSSEEFQLLYPQKIKGSNPVIPAGTKFAKPSLPMPSIPQDSVWAHIPGVSLATINHFAEDQSGIGSNNWAISGTHTVHGESILCNDPHLGLNLPSLWFEMQMQSPEVNVYGVSLPGAPGIVIGFNDSIAWGFTNNYRDVKDFYEIERVGNSNYLFDGAEKKMLQRLETIKIKNKPDFIDTVNYTLHGPIMYEPNFPDPLNTGKYLAMQWMAHRPTNELLALFLLNRANNYDAFTKAIFHFECPAQNMVFADRLGNISMWGQGQFINKWRDQGRYIMKGNTSSTLWGKLIPMEENPHVLNPPQGYVASANQIVTDSTYPYWYNGYFYDFRAWRINELLQEKSKLWAIEDNMLIQNDVLSILARRASSKMAPETLKDWNDKLDAQSMNATVFQILWAAFYEKLWNNRFGHSLPPSTERTLELLTDSTSRYRHQIDSAIVYAVKVAKDSIEKLSNTGVAWYQVKGTQLTHLARLDAFSYKNLEIGGWGNTLNAAKKIHGPSWRMIVEMGKDSISAFGVYPGGQSGNPGSKFYGTFVDHWVEGKYYRIAFYAKQTTPNDKTFVCKWNIKPQ